MKNKILLKIFIVLILIIMGFFILNIEVTTRQGLDYKVYTLKMPLYLKILDFYDRHYNYKWLVNRIIDKGMDDEEKVMVLFKWTIENLKVQPKELRVVDDHVWHIIIRGYGANDQFSDVFTTLCNYAGIKAFFMRLSSGDGAARYTFSCAKIKDRWYLFDPYYQAYFIKEDNRLASVKDIQSGNWKVKTVGDMEFPRTQDELRNLFSGLGAIDFEVYQKWSRANIQNPMNRFLYGVFKRYFTKESYSQSDKDIDS